MKISLKKAAALATALSALQTPAQPRINLSIYGDNSPEGVKDRIKTVVDEQEAIVAHNLALNAAVYDIRHLIGKANEGRINFLLTERALIDKQLQLLNSIPTTPAPNFEHLSRQLTARAAMENPSTDLVPIPTPMDFSMQIKSLKRERVKIEDELAQLNFTTMIELPEDVVTILTDNDLV